MSSVQLQLRRDIWSTLSSFVGALGEVLVDTTNNRLVVQDGVTPGGYPAAKLSEVVTKPLGANGSNIQFGLLEGTITCSGATSVSTIVIPANAIVLAVSSYVVTAMTGATSFNVDATTSPSGASGSTSGQFGASLSIAAGTTKSGVIAPTPWYNASTIKLTANGNNFTAGLVRISIQYMLCGAPTS